MEISQKENDVQMLLAAQVRPLVSGMGQRRQDGRGGRPSPSWRAWCHAHPGSGPAAAPRPGRSSWTARPGHPPGALASSGPATAPARRRPRPPHPPRPAARPQAHLGTKNCTSAMERYVYRRRNDGIFVFNLEKTWQKLQLAARIIVAIENPQARAGPCARHAGLAACWRCMAGLTPHSRLTAAWTGAPRPSLRQRAVARWRRRCSRGCRPAGPTSPAHPLALCSALLQDIVAISARPYGQRAVLKFANYTGAKSTVGRHTPGAHPPARLACRGCCRLPAWGGCCCLRMAAAAAACCVAVALAAAGDG